MAKKCFVIMPFGGDDDAASRHFLGVYHTIFKPAAEACGYTVKRADTERVPGNITTDVINDLAEADMVIADLTGGNANVFFELGIRHVLRKSGTVHVVDRKAAIPFDVRQYRAIEYSTHLADIPIVIDEILDAIRKREDDAARSDNPVHDVLVGLPADYREVSDEARQREIETLRVSLGQVKRERDSLTQKLTDLDPGGSLAGHELDVDEMLDHADEVMKSTGEYVMLRLQEIINTGGRDAFVRELRSVVKSPHLSGNDFVGLAKMCRGLSLTDHRRVVLEIANQRLPNESRIFLALVDAYDDSPAPALQERGRLMVEAHLKITRPNPAANPVISPNLPLGRYTLDNGLVLLFNFYFRANKSEWVLSVCESAGEAGYTGAVLGRNQARALARLGRKQDAEAKFRDTLEHYENDPSTHQLFAEFLNSIERHAEAYEQSEAGIAASPSSANGYISLAIDILNNNLTRNADEKIVSVGPDGALKSAIPIIQAGLAYGELSDRQHAVNLLVRRNAFVEAQAIAQGNSIDDGNYDVSALKYVLELISRKRKAGSPANRQAT